MPRKPALSKNPVKDNTKLSYPLPEWLSHELNIPATPWAPKAVGVFTVKPPKPIPVVKYKSRMKGSIAKENIAKHFQGSKPKTLRGGAGRKERSVYASELGKFRKSRSKR